MNKFKINKILKKNKYFSVFLIIVIFLILRYLIDIFLLSKNSKKEGFDNSNDNFIYYYMNECGHCKNFNPKWNELKKKFHEKHKDSNIKLSKIERAEIKNNENIKGFPTLRVVKKDGTQIDYDGNRDPDKIIGFLEKTFNLI
tara:strand:+ start:5049 stop:5474 length:426 start_codon:yes stop_codon:yes gene_type:complete